MFPWQGVDQLIHWPPLLHDIHHSERDMVDVEFIRLVEHKNQVSQCSFCLIVAPRPKWTWNFKPSSILSGWDSTTLGFCHRWSVGRKTSLVAVPQKQPLQSWNIPTSTTISGNLLRNIKFHDSNCWGFRIGAIHLWKKCMFQTLHSDFGQMLIFKLLCNSPSGRILLKKIESQVILFVSFPWFPPFLAVAGQAQWFALRPRIRESGFGIRPRVGHSKV